MRNLAAHLLVVRVRAEGSLGTIPMSDGTGRARSRTLLGAESYLEFGSTHRKVDCGTAQC